MTDNHVGFVLATIVILLGYGVYHLVDYIIRKIEERF